MEIKLSVRILENKGNDHNKPLDFIGGKVPRTVLNPRCKYNLLPDIIKNERYKIELLTI